MTCGIYMIKNTQTGQIYIGQAVNIEKRWGEHLRGKNLGHSYIDNAIQKYGKKNFVLKIITQLPNNKKVLNEHEKYWINFYDTFKNSKHYNLTPGGDFNPMDVPKIQKKHKKSIIGKKHPNAHGIKNPNARYTLWDSHKVKYNIGNMFHNNRKPNPCKCFYVNHEGKRLKIDGFIDFLTCEIIYNLIER